MSRVQDSNMKEKKRVVLVYHGEQNYNHTECPIEPIDSPDKFLSVMVKNALSSVQVIM